MTAPPQSSQPRWGIRANLFRPPFFRCLLAGLLIGGGVVFAQQSAEGPEEAFDRLAPLYAEVLEAARQHYGGEVSYRQLIYASIQGMLRGLDPHTSFLSPRAFASMQERQAATYSGIGVLVSMREGRLTVVSPIEGGPAGDLGIQAGDIIEAVDGQATEFLTLSEAISRIKGPQGTQVAITIRRRGIDEPIELTITRAELPQTTVRFAYMMTPRIAYLRLTDFNQSTAEEMSRALAALEEQGMQRLLLDLRNNGGGLLDQAIQVASIFVPEGEIVVETRGRVANFNRTFRSQGKAGQWEIPVVALVNRGTASAAEILSGALQDHDLGLLAGTPTWGKGLVQTVYRIAGNAGLALTTARYHTPSGRQIQRDFSSLYDYYAAAVPPSARGQVQGRAAEKPFSTSLGRTVYGGGGIRPDVVVESAELASFQQTLLIRNVFMKFAVDYKRRHDRPAPSWRAEAETLDEFRQWLIQEGLLDETFLDEAFSSEAERRSALGQISAAVLNSYYGPEMQHRVLAESDPQIQAALDLFDASAALLERRRSQ